MNHGPCLSADGRFVAAPMSRRVLNFGDMMTQTARRLPDRPALVWREKVWSWRELNARVDALAHALAAAGVGKGDRILLMSRNNNAMFEALYAAFKLGAIVVPANFRLAADEFAYLGAASRARALVYDSVFADHADAARRETSGLATLVAIGTARAGEHEFEAFIAPHLGKPFSAASVEYDDAMWFFFTSGTTGRPKAAVLTHGQMGFVVANMLADLTPGANENDGSLVVAPLSHGAGIHQLTQVARGATTVLLPSEKLDVAEAWRLVERWRVANMFTVPTILNMLVDHASVDEYDRSSLRHVIYAGAPMYREDQKRIVAKLGKCIVQYFGLGEVTGSITVLPPALHDVDDSVQGHIGSCGYPRTGMDVRILDDAGIECAIGATGEICVAGPGVFAGYFDNAEANAKAFRDGWFRTGDLGHMDAEGFVHITGRASDMYISGGSNVYPRETEEKLIEHPAVAEAAIVGMPDRKWGETGVAVVVLREGAHASEADILGFLAGRVARYKLPSRVVFWDELPKSGYGKVPKRLIKERLMNEAAKDA
ncbi:MAG: AMP-binding protein [Hyphomicrobiales bacterium]|nr:AMP-binding protein [Hyphomicrobiales bacterium]